MESELATAQIAGGARGYIVVPYCECSTPKGFKMICGIAIPAGPVYVGSLTQSCQQRRTAGGSVLREEQGLRPASRNGSPRRADQREYQQAKNRYFGYFQMSTLWTCLSKFKPNLVIPWEYCLSAIPPKNDTSFYLGIGYPKLGLFR